VVMVKVFGSCKSCKLLFNFSETKRPLYFSSNTSVNNARCWAEKLCFLLAICWAKEENSASVILHIASVLAANLKQGVGNLPQ